MDSRSDGPETGNADPADELRGLRRLERPKMGPGISRRIEADSPDTSNADLLVGQRIATTPAVYRITDGFAIVSTVDFFPPIVTIPTSTAPSPRPIRCPTCMAMGGQVLFALNVGASARHAEALIRGVQGGADRWSRRAGSSRRPHGGGRRAQNMASPSPQGRPQSASSSGRAQARTPTLPVQALGTGRDRHGRQDDSLRARRARGRGAEHAAPQSAAADVAPGAVVRARQDISGFGLLGPRGRDGRGLGCG